MITPWDRSYRAARAVRRGEALIDPALDGFVARFGQVYGVAPLWLGLDQFRRQAGDAPIPRLEVVLERTAQASRFGIGPYFDPAKQREVARLLTDSVGADELAALFDMLRVEADRIHVVLADFERVAKTEAHLQVTDGELAVFEAALGLGEALWCVRRPMGPPIVFVHTQSQAAALADSQTRRRWAEAYFALVQRHDEFGYLTQADIAIQVDSRENFEANYDGNWAYYLR